MLIDLLGFLVVAAVGYWIYKRVASSYEDYKAVEASQSREVLAKSDLQQQLPEIAAAVGGRVLSDTPQKCSIRTHRMSLSSDTRLSLTRPRHQFLLQVDVKITSKEPVLWYGVCYPWDSGELMFSTLDEIMTSGHILKSQQMSQLLPADLEPGSVSTYQRYGLMQLDDALRKGVAREATATRYEFKLNWGFPTVSASLCASAIEATHRLAKAIHDDAVAVEKQRVSSLLELLQKTEDVGFCLSATLTLLCYFSDQPECVGFVNVWKDRWRACWPGAEEPPYATALFGEPAAPKHQRKRCIVQWSLVFLVHWAEFGVSGVRDTDESAQDGATDAAERVAVTTSGDAPSSPDDVTAEGEAFFARYCEALGKPRGTPPQTVIQSWPRPSERPMIWLLRNFVALWGYLPKEDVLPLWDAMCERFAYGAISPYQHVKPPAVGFQRSKDKLRLHPLHEGMWRAYGKRLPPELLSDGLTDLLLSESREEILEGLGVLALLFSPEEQQKHLLKIVVWEMIAQGEDLVDPTRSQQQTDRFSLFRELLDTMAYCEHPSLETLLIAMLEQCDRDLPSMEPLIERLGAIGGVPSLRALYQLSRRNPPGSAILQLQQSMAEIEKRLQLSGTAGALSVIDIEDDSAGALSLDVSKDGMVSLADDPKEPS